MTSSRPEIRYSWYLQTLLSIICWAWTSAPAPPSHSILHTIRNSIYPYWQRDRSSKTWSCSLCNPCAYRLWSSIWLNYRSDRLGISESLHLSYLHSVPSLRRLGPKELPRGINVRIYKFHYRRSLWSWGWSMGLGSDSRNHHIGIHCEGIAHGF